MGNINKLEDKVKYYQCWAKKEKQSYPAYRVNDEPNKAKIVF